ncbi:Ribosyl nicotinamide transporter, PnuC-like [Pseudomonas batumici]|uniref:Nicotinamide riboside transporter PnuC n=1 Tax=Pseudomonas batumici TaxID=226910 RepID=A0A0C2I7C6_9PSED|nr:Ribosyl nicotinamide transporter, PnuC-like [Pseudomonas batumici]
MSTLEIIAVLVNVLGVWLTARRIRWCWPVGVVAVLLYAWIFYDAKLYSDTLLQGIFAVLQGYGWWRWSQGELSEGKVHVARLSWREGLLGLLCGALGAGVLPAYRCSGAVDGCIAHRLQPGGQCLGGAQVCGQLVAVDRAGRPLRRPVPVQGPATDSGAVRRLRGAGDLWPAGLAAGPERPGAATAPRTRLDDG